MPIGGFVIAVTPSKGQQAVRALSALDGVEVYGAGGDGEVIAVLETRTSKDMEQLVDRISAMDFVASVSLAYLNAEDEMLQQ